MALSFTFGNPKLDGWILLHQTYNLIVKCEETEFVKSEITPQQYWVLQAINYLGQYRKGPVTQKDVAQLLDRNANSITLIITRMEKAGLVERKIRELPDLRAVRLVITPKGQAAIERAQKPAWELIESIMAALSEEEQKVCNALLKRIRAAVLDHIKPGETIEEVKV